MAVVFVLVAVGIRVACELGWGQGSSQKVANENGDQDLVRGQIIDLLRFTDTTLRLMKETGDAELARTYIDKWTAMRTSLKPADNTEISLGVIEGQLNAIHDRLYPRKASWSYLDSFGWHDPTEWFDNEASEESIRVAESQLMRSFTIPWKETQSLSTFQSKYAALRDLCRQIAAASKPLPSGLPKPLASDEASKLIRDLEILYAEIPFIGKSGLPSPYEQKQADIFEFPSFVDDKFKRHYLTKTERDCFALAADIVYSRSQLPIFEDSLNGKTQALKFSEQYAKSLGYLENAVGR